MLPTISERRLHDAAPYAAHHQPHSQHDDDRRDWRYAGAPPSSRPAYAYDEAPPGQAPAPLPPLRSTLSYRDDDAWGQRALPPPPPPHAAVSSAVAQSHTRSRLDLFSHLPLSSSSRVQVVDDHGAVDEDDQDDDAYHRHHGTHPYHVQQHQQHAAMHHDLKFLGEPKGTGSSSAAASAAAAAAAKRRSRRMSNSERGKLYRSRRKEYVETLEDQVEALKQQLEEMRVKGHSGASDQPARPSSPYDTLPLSRDRSRAGLSRIVCEYFSLFQFGVPVSPSNSASGAGNSQLQIGSPSQGLISQSPRLLSFIETLVDPNMRFGENFGVQMLLEQWQRYSAYHSSLQYDLNSIEVVSHETSPLISATATLRVRFSRTTIEKVFPHVLWNEELVQRLIGLEVEYPVANKFYFGPDGKIKRYETEVDFVSAFAKALGNMHDAMQLVGKARIKEQHRIGDDGAEDASTNHAFGTSSSRSPTGSQDSGASSRSSVHSHSPSPDLSAAEVPLRSRFKQTEVRTGEDQYGEYSPQSSARRFPTEPRTGQGYYEETVASRPYARAAGEPGLRHHHYHQPHVNDDERDPHDHHDRRSFPQYH